MLLSRDIKGIGLRHDLDSGLRKGWEIIKCNSEVFPMGTS